MTVTDLISNFRTVLLALGPAFERVGLPWKRPNAYDEWDELVEAAYEALVVQPVRSALSELQREQLRLPRYDMLLPAYAESSLIEVLPSPDEHKIRVFHALGTADTPFDTVEWRLVEPTGLPRSPVFEQTPLAGTEFALRLRVDDPAAGRIERLAIDQGGH